MITIDPNLRGCGVSWWARRLLGGAAYVKNPKETGRGYAVFGSMADAVVDHLNEVAIGVEGPVIIEMPVIYPGMPDKDLNDLLDVIGVGAAVAHALMEGGIESVFPSQWKGQLEKKKMLIRIRGKLTPQELAVMQVTNKSDTEDILDSVGIGLWKLNRLSRRVYPGAEE